MKIGFERQARAAAPPRRPLPAARAWPHRAPRPPPARAPAARAPAAAPRARSLPSRRPRARRRSCSRPSEAGARQMTVAYYLILDNKRRKQVDLDDHARDRRLRRRRRPEPRVDARAAGVGAAGGAAAADGDAAGDAPGAAARAGGRARRRDACAAWAPRRAGPPPTRPPRALRPPPPPPADRPPRPHPSSSMAPADMMLEIFRTLRVLQFEWKIVAQHSLVPAALAPSTAARSTRRWRCAARSRRAPAVQDPRGPDVSSTSARSTATCCPSWRSCCALLIEPADPPLRGNADRPAPGAV